jgi:Leucine-rich repeat (LRR) protein
MSTFKSSLTLPWRLLLLLSITASAICNDVTSEGDNDAESPTCPTNCSCIQDNNQGPSLTIDCSSRTGLASTLSKEIDAFLSNRSDELVSLVLTGTPLTSLPTSVCQQVHLQRLVLDYNELTSLPVGCFNNMTELQSFTASNNNLSSIMVQTSLLYRPRSET